MQGLFATVRDCIRREEPVALATVVALTPQEGSDPLPGLGAKLVARRDGEAEGSLGDAALDRAVLADLEAALGNSRSGTRHYGPHGEARQTEITVFIEVFAPPRRMIIFGAVDFTAALARTAKVLGYHVTVCDARPIFATVARFREADEVVADWPDRYLATVADRLGPLDAVCVLTHDHKFDVPAIVGSLATRVGYIGVMGSRRTHRERLARLSEAGVTDAEIGRLMAPIGIDIGARSPEETAISICAEIISLNSGTKAASLRDGSGPIHHGPQ
jgi:xanthine dehydrogenase accessory factor